MTDAEPQAEPVSAAANRTEPDPTPAEAPNAEAPMADPPPVAAPMADDDGHGDRPGREPGEMLVALSPRQIIGGFAFLAGVILMLRRRRRDRD